MTTEQRLNRLEDEFETVKELLMSAARYAESANSGLSLLTERGDRTQAQLDQLAVKVDALTNAQEGTQSQLDQLAVKVDALANAQEGTQAQLDRLSLRIDSFVFEVGRLFTQQSERLDRSEGQTERLEAIVQMLNRNYQAQQSQLQELQRATTEFQRASQEYQRSNSAALERIDRILDYLLRQNRGDQA